MEIQTIGNEAAHIESIRSRPVSKVASFPITTGRDSVELSHFQEEYNARRIEEQDSLDMAPRRLFNMDEDSESFSSDTTQIQFTRDSESGRFAISVIDSETKEVLREIPPQAVLDVLSKLSQSREQVFHLLS